MSGLSSYSSTVLVLIAAWACLSPTPSEASPTGAPMAACVTMTPNHNATAQTSPSIYSLRVARLSADSLSVSIVMSAAPFRGFLIQVRRDGSDTPIGTFDPDVPAGTRLLQCSAAGDSVTHSSRADKTGVTFTWHSPGGSLTGTRFVATTCLDYLTFWVKYTSIDLGDVMGENLK